jgi:hypothetical protein
MVTIKQCLESTGKSLAVMSADEGNQPKSFEDNFIPQETPASFQSPAMSHYLHEKQVSAISHLN